MKSEERADILIEAIEVLINQILYLRDAYPQQIFKKRRIFNSPVYASIFPPLNTYLHNILRSAKELLNEQDNDGVCELRRIDLIFYIDENKVIERHMFEFFDLSKTQGMAEDEFLLDFEEQLRKSLYEMPERLKLLKELPHEAKMSIRLYTTQSGHIQLSNKAHFQDFPWIQSGSKAVESVDTSKQWYLLPITTVQKFGFNVIAEVC